jgi:hypothetical protein
MRMKFITPPAMLHDTFRISRADLCEKAKLDTMA